MKSRFFVLFGKILIFASLAIIILTFLPIAKNEIKYSLAKPQEISQITPVNSDFGIVVPKLGINSPVLPNVDPTNSDIYQKALTKGVAHAQGSSLPGEGGNVFIFSHSSANFYEATRYNSIFYLLNKLEAGDEIFVFYKNQKYTYEVENQLLVDGKSVEYINKNAGNTLTLMTCWPPGTSLKRLLVSATLRE